jgi:hypothetical protein
MAVVQHTQDPVPPGWLSGGGELADLIRRRDWAGTSLGPLESWPQILRSVTGMMLASRAQIILFWGPDFTGLYNDAYRPVFALKHPWALGKPAREAWSEIWDTQLGPLLEGVVASGEAFSGTDLPFVLERLGYPEETYFDVSYDPVRDESGTVAGVYCIVSETTGRVIGERRLRVLRDLGKATSAARRGNEVFEVGGEVLAASNRDISFALAYAFDTEAKCARRVCAVNVPEGRRVGPGDPRRIQPVAVRRGRRHGTGHRASRSRAARRAARRRVARIGEARLRAAARSHRKHGSGRP